MRFPIEVFLKGYACGLASIMIEIPPSTQQKARQTITSVFKGTVTTCVQAFVVSSSLRPEAQRLSGEQAFSDSTGLKVDQTHARDDAFFFSQHL